MECPEAEAEAEAGGGGGVIWVFPGGGGGGGGEGFLSRLRSPGPTYLPLDGGPSQQRRYEGGGAVFKCPPGHRNGGAYEMAGIHYLFGWTIFLKT